MMKGIDLIMIRKTNEGRNLQRHLNRYIRNSRLEEDYNADLEYSPDLDGYFLEDLIDDGYLDWDDVNDLLENIARRFGGSVYRWAEDGFTITHLDEDSFDEWENNFNDYFWDRIEQVYHDTYGR